jgi:hypothetical protein
MLLVTGYWLGPGINKQRATVTALVRFSEQKNL